MAKQTETPTPRPTRVRARGSKEDLDISVVWVRAMLHASLGPEVGEAHFRKLPALQGLLWFRGAWERGMKLGEQ